MNKAKLNLGIILTIIGLLGVLSILTLNLPIPPEIQASINERFTPIQFKLLTLINPTILLLFSVIIGTILYQKVNLSVPIIENLVGIRKKHINTFSILQYGVLGGIITGISVVIIGLLFLPFIPSEFIALNEKFQPTLLAKFLYGGITEEILLRFGLMTFIIWLSSKIAGTQKPIIYWIGIIIAAIIFAIGHFPIVFFLTDTPTVGLLFYIFIANTIGGIIFGWLYWKKGLESSFIAHIFAHIVMILGASF